MFEWICRDLVEALKWSQTTNKTKRKQNQFETLHLDVLLYFFVQNRYRHALTGSYNPFINGLEVDWSAYQKLELIWWLEKEHTKLHKDETKFCFALLELCLFWLEYQWLVKSPFQPWHRSQVITKRCLVIVKFSLSAINIQALNSNGVNNNSSIKTLDAWKLSLKIH